MDWILALALGTFALVIAFLLWNRQSTKRNQETGSAHASGVGGPKDPLSGDSEGMRNPDDLRASLDGAAAAPAPGKRLLD